MARTKVHGEYLDPSVISAQTEVTAVGSDHMLIFDATDNALKKALLSDLIETVGSTPTFTSVTVNGDIDASGLLKVGTNDSEYANNYIRFKPTGAAYIDHNTTGQDINFRVSNSSSLDTTPLTVTSSGITATGLTVGLDTDIQAHIGRAKVGYMGFADFAGFAHRDNALTGSYALLQYSTGETYLNAASGRDINIRINNSNVALFNSEGNFGIGTTSLTNNTLGKTTYFGNNTSTITGDSSQARFWLGNNWYYNSGDKFIDTGYANLYTQQSGTHQFLTSTASGSAGQAATFNNYMTIDVSGNVGLGTDTPTNYYSGADNLVIYEASGEGGISVVTATNTTGALYFADGTSGNQQYRGGIAYQHGNDQLALVSGGATKATIDASGHFDLDGYIDNTRNNGSISAPSNSDHTAGTRIKFYDAGGSTWYGMGIEGNHLWFNADPGFKFYSNASLSATIDDDGLKFNADTAAANALDDYEEGTWTPVMHSSGGSVSASYSYRSAYYIKIGNSVYVRWGFRLSSRSGGSGNAQVTGLPFTSKNYGSYQQPAAFVNAQNLTTDPDGPVLFYLVDNNTKIEGRLMNNADTGLPISYFQNGSWCIGHFTYDVS